MKDREFYAKLVFGARWKKVDKFLASGELEEKTWGELESRTWDEILGGEL